MPPKKHSTSFPVVFAIFFLVVLVPLHGIPIRGSIVPCAESIKKVGPIYITPNETQQLHLNNFFSGYNLNYSLLYNSNSCLPLLEISQGLRLLSKSNTSLSSEKFTWSFYKDKSNFKSSIVGLDKKTNTLFSTSIEIGSDYIEFNSFADLSSYNASCQHFITFQNHSLIGVLCAFSNSSELFFVYNRSNSSQYIGGPFILSKTQNFTAVSDIRFVFNEGDCFYFIRFWQSRNKTLSATGIEVWLYNATASSTSFLKTLDKSFFGMDSLEIRDLRVHNAEIFFSEWASCKIVRFTFTKDCTVDYHSVDSYLEISKIWVYEYGLISPSLYIAVVNTEFNFIYVANWTEKDNPILIERYSIPQVYEEIDYINFNEDFLLYFARKDNESNYFTVYRRGQKLMKDIYLDLKFSRWEHALFEFIPETNNLLIFSNITLSNYLLYDPILKINASNVSISDSYQICQATINIASRTSRNDQTPQELNDTISIQVVNSDDTNLYPLADEIKPHSYIDYPGQVQFNLDQFYAGPAISYRLKMFQSSQPQKVSDGQSIDFDSQDSDIEPAPLESPPFRINKINSLDFESLQDIQQKINASMIIWQNMVSNPLNSSILFWFIQMSNYTLFLVECQTVNIENSPNCYIRGNLSGLNSQVVNLSLAFKENLLWLALKVESNLFDIQFYDMSNLSRKRLNLPFGKGVLDQIFDFTIMDFKIVVCFPLRKTIWIIDLNSPSSVLFVINETLLDKKYNYPYFSPMRVKSQYLHQDILFILDRVCIYIVDISDINEGDIVIIQRIESPATKKLGSSFYYLAISKKSFVIISKYPEIIEEYSLSNYNMIYKRKNYPLYNYSIVLKPDSFDFNDFDCEGGFLFIHAVDQQMQASILIFKTAVIGHNVLYGVIPLNTRYAQILVQTAGISTMYLGIISSPNISFYQVSRNATLIMNLLQITAGSMSSDQMNLNVTVTNSFQSFNISYSLTTWDSGVNISVKHYELEDYSRTIRLKKDSMGVSFPPNSRFSGSIISYSIQCDSDCGRVSNSTKIYAPISLSSTLMEIDEYTALETTPSGYLIQTNDELLTCSQNFQKLKKFKFNNTRCTKMAHHSASNLTVSACKRETQNYMLYLIDSNSDLLLSNVSVPFDSIAYFKFIQNYLVILNAMENEDQLGNRESMIFIYFLEVQNKSLWLFDTVVSDDVELNFLIATGIDLDATPDNQTLRFFILDRYQGLRVLDLNITNKLQTKLSYFDLLSLVKSDGVDNEVVQFAGLRVVNTDRDKERNLSNYSMIVSTVNFHNYEILLRINESASESQLMNVWIERCFWRYGFYSATNKIFSHGNNSRFFVIPYVLSNDLMINYNKYSKQILILFDRFNTIFFNRTPSYGQEYQGENYNYSVLLGGFILNSSSTPYFAKLISVNDSFSNLIFNNPETHTIDQLSLRPNLSIAFDQPYSNDSQLFLILSNDYNTTNLTYTIITGELTDDGETKAWIIGLVIALLVVAVILIFIVKKYGKKTEEEEDLLENDEENDEIK